MENQSMPTTTKPFPSWTWYINENGIGYWDAPVLCPNEPLVVYKWNEETLTWDVATPAPVVE